MCVFLCGGDEMGGECVCVGGVGWEGQRKVKWQRRQPPAGQLVPRNPRIKKLQKVCELEIITGSGIHNNKLAIYLPVSGLPPGDGHRVKQMAAFHQRLSLARSLSLSLFSLLLLLGAR